MSSEEELKKSVLEDPGSPAFAELAELFRKRGGHAEALEICLVGLARNPTCHLGRLVLARIFYDRRMYSFAVRELEALREALPQSKTVTRLLEKLSPGASLDVIQRTNATADETVAETDFDFEELDLIGQEKK